MTPPLKIHRVHPAAELPTRAHSTDAGLDLSCTNDVVLLPGRSNLVQTGIAVGLPPGHAGLVCPRSGLASRWDIGIVNAPGVIDEGYTGEIHVHLINHGSTSVILPAGSRIAQLLVVPVSYPQVVEVDALDPSERGNRGHGSTGS